MARATLALIAAQALACATATPPPEPPPSELARVDPVATAETVEPPPPPEPAVEPPVEPPPPPPPPRHYKLLIIGDSMAATDFGDALEKQLEKHQFITCKRR